MIMVLFKCILSLDFGKIMKMCKVHENKKSFDVQIWMKWDV